MLWKGRIWSHDDSNRNSNRTGIRCGNCLCNMHLDFEKTNDFGDSTATLEQYTGYDPVEITNQGQIAYN